ncbi:hypothetical protein ACS0TY_026766 [Phlomoides rotata]
MEDRNEKRYCVTGATGYIGSWLVKTLLQKGYTVHATFRDPEKASHLFKFWEGRDRLSLFRADLLEDGSFDEAVRDCDGVFHVAASMEVVMPAAQNLDSYVKTEVIDPAVRGTVNVLKACLKTNTARRIVFTSSISTLTAKDTSGRWIPVVDESCQTPVDQVLKTKARGWLLTEEAAFKFAVENGIDLISVITTTVGGPFLTPTVPVSIQVLLSPITGDPNLLPILASVNSRMGSIALVHIEDICNAHIFLMEHNDAKGRYLCCTRSCVMSELVELLTKEYTCSIPPREKVSDFGLVKLAPDGEMSVATRLAGTFGYLAPEYAVTGKITTKVDVFSFGVVLLELLTGLVALDERRPEENRHLAEWFWQIKSNKNSLVASIDPALEANEDIYESIYSTAELAGHCTARDPNHRPDMGYAVNVLVQLVEKWIPHEETDECWGISMSLPLPQMLKGWQQEADVSGTTTSSQDSKGSIPAKPSGFADSFTSADAR